MINDAECLQKYAESRDQDAFSDFVHRNLRLVYSAACRQTGGDTHLAEDITQVVFTKAARNARALARHPVVPAWLHQSTRNAAIDALRTRQRRQTREEAACAMNESASQADELADWDKISPELDRLVASLGEKDREAVILRFFGEKSFAEIGHQLRLSENAARMRVDRALDKLRANLARKGIVSSATALGAVLANKAAIAAPAGLGTATVTAAVSAPAAAGVALLWTTLQIMSITKATAGIAAAIAIASMATAIHEYRSARSAEEALTAYKVAQQAKPAAPTSSPATSSDADPARKATTAGKASQAKPQAVNPLAAVIAVLSNPVIQAQSSITTKIRLDTQYGALFKKLGLAPDKLEQFKNLVVEKQLVAFDSIAAANEQGIDAFNDTQGFLQVVANSIKGIDTQIAGVLGEDGYRQFTAYENTVPARNTVSILGQALSFTDTPLTNAQTEQVVTALTVHGTPAMPPSNPFSVLNSDLGIIKLSDQGRTQLQGTLSPQQMTVLEEKIQQQLQLLEVRSRIGRQD